MAAGIPAEGTLFQRGDGASPEIFNDVGRVYSIGAAGKETPPIDVTAFADAVRQYINGMPTMTQISIGVRYDPGDSEQTGLRDDQTARTRRNFQIVWNSSPPETWAFTAIVTSFGADAALDDAIMATINLQPTTDFTITTT